MIGLFAPPVFASEEETQRARVFRTVVLFTMLLVTAFFPVIMVQQPSTIPRAVYALTVVNVLGVVLLQVYRRGQIQLASVLFVTGLVLLVTSMALTAGGIRAFGATMYFVIVLMSTLLLGELAGIVTALICAALGLGLVLVDAAGFLPSQTAPYTAITLWLLNCMSMGVVIVLLKLATQKVTAALHQVEVELTERRKVITQLKKAEQQRERLVLDLGERVKELKLLHAAAQLLRDRSIDRTVLADLVRAMPSAWLYPEICEARIAYLDIDVSTPGWRDSPWRQSAPFVTAAGKGVIEVVYTAERPQAEEGPFLAEERQLLDSLVEMLTAHFEREASEQKRGRAETEAKENQALLQTMIENTPAAVAMFDKEMRYIACSRRWLSDYRLGNRELQGLSHYEVFPEIAEDWKAVHRRCLAGRIESREADRFLRADGTEDVVRWVVQPWRKGNGEIGGITMFTEVITERWTLEARLRQSQKMEALGTLAGGIAHDFNNILGAIYGFAGLLGDENGSKAEDRRFIQSIRSACERGRDLIAQIRTFSRAENAEREVVDLVRIVRQSSDLLLATLPKATALRFTYAERQLPVLGSEALLGQVVTNLCINASEALNDKSGEIGVSIARAASKELNQLRAKVMPPGERLVGKIGPSNDYACLRVSDHAGGISDAVLDRMFEPFFTTKGRQRGTGLGLAIAHGVIDSHGGACHVASVEGEGAIFSVYLPLHSGLVTQLIDGQAPRNLRGGERVLIVDDEPDIVDMLSIGLERLGYETVGVTDPLEALTAFEENPGAWDAVITDEVMPRMSGVELVRRLKTMRPEIKIVLCTGYSDNANEESLDAHLIDSLVLKPADAAILAEKLRRLIDPRLAP